MSSKVVMSLSRSQLTYLVLAPVYHHGEFYTGTRRIGLAIKFSIYGLRRTPRVDAVSTDDAGSAGYIPVSQDEKHDVEKHDERHDVEKYDVEKHGVDVSVVGRPIGGRECAYVLNTPREWDSTPHCKTWWTL
jgi:hypothetical protein